MLVFREGHHAVADIAGRQYAVFSAQAAGTAPVVSDCHNGGEVRNGPQFRGDTPWGNVRLQTAENGREASTAAKRNYSCGLRQLLQIPSHKRNGGLAVGTISFGIE